MTTEEIARAFLVPAPTLAQRILRAKNKIRDAGIPYEVPFAHSARADLLRRLGRGTEAVTAYERALGLCTQDIDRRFLGRRISEVGGQTTGVSGHDR